jgi:putative FmdB family regulatory protein
MPIYEYKCKNCGDKFEIFVFSYGETGAICPECGSENIERLMSGFASTGSGAESGKASCGGTGRFS